MEVINKRREILIKHIHRNTSCGMKFALKYYNSDYYMRDAQVNLSKWNQICVERNGWRKITALLGLYTVAIKNKHGLTPEALDEIVNDGAWNEINEDNLIEEPSYDSRYIKTSTPAKSNSRNSYNRVS